MSEALNSSVDGQENVQPNIPNASGNVDSSKPAVDQNLLSLGGGSISANLSIIPTILQGVPAPPSFAAGIIHGGGVANSPNIATANTAIPSAGAITSESTAAAGQGVTSALLNVVQTPPGEASSHAKANQARLSFDFKNPFEASGRGSSRISVANLAALPSVSAASSDLQSELDRRVVESVAEKPFSKLTAEELASSLVSKITNFKSAVWIREDISGQAIIENVEPALLSDMLLSVAEISSLFHQLRVENLIYDLIEKDMSISSTIRAKWATARAAKLDGARNSAAINVQQTPANMPRVLFQPSIPSAAGSLVSPSTPAFFGSGVDGRLSSSPIQMEPPSFMSEVPSRLAFPVCESSHFNLDPNQGRAFVSGGGAAGIPAGFNITIHQASTTPPDYTILETCSDANAFYVWLKKNRKALLLARPCDRKRLNELCSQEVQEELGRIIATSKRVFQELFKDNHPAPTCWPEVSDALLLRVLFGIHGPRSANDAKERLELRPFFFNDSTTYQDQFVGKFRKFNSAFKTTLADFSYSSHQWDPTDILSKEMIRDAYIKCMSSTDTVKNLAGVMVPKCHNLTLIRELIKQKKGLPLEEIMNFLVDHFDRQDAVIRSTKGLAYSVHPWNLQSKKPQKRGVNQVTAPAAQGASKSARPPRPPALYPRCGNCGSKAHACSERTCYLWGHPKGLGATGNWPDGTPSLSLVPTEWSDWKKIRHAIFYSYPENQKPRKQGA
jgi:hypothetical protein